MSKSEDLQHEYFKSLRDAADMFLDRDGEYGSLWHTNGDLFKLLFPTGITLKTAEDFSRFHSITLVMTKLRRYAINFADGHDDSLIDLVVYAAMLRAKDEAYKCSTETSED